MERGALPKRWRARILVVLSVSLVVAALLCSAIGSVRIPISAIVTILLHSLGLGTRGFTDQEQAVFLAIRLPRVVLALLVGGALGSSGAAMQGVFRNPLVDPGLLGVSGGAALAAVTTIVLGERLASGISPAIAPFALPVAAFVGAVSALVVVERIARVEGRLALSTLLLAGIAVGAICGALTGLLTYCATDAQLRTITFWSLGSLGGATWKVVLAALPFLLLPILALPRVARSLDAMLLGDSEARLLGFDVERTRKMVIVLVAIAVGASVAVAGVLGFVGLVVPHLLRLVGGPDHRLVLPGSALLGAVLLLSADAIARTLVTPAELPLGVVTASLGGPFFIALLLRERRRLT